MVWNQSYADAVFLMIKVACPLLLIFGSFGNILTVVVFCRLRDYSAISTFYIALALCDLALLYLGGLTHFWLYFQFHVELVSLNDISCKIFGPLPFISSALSSWYLVAMTMQRAMSVIWPHRVNVVCTQKFSRVITAVIGLVIIVSHSHLFIGLSLPVDINKNSSCPVCRCSPVNEGYIYFYHHVWVVTDLLLSSLCPFVLLLVSNIVLVKAVLTSAKNVRHRLAVGQSTHVTERESQAFSLSVTLIVLSITFFVLTGPVRVVMIVNPYVRGQQITLEDYDIDLIFFLLYIPFVANSAVNFYLYCLTGTKFRKEVCQLLGALSTCKTIINTTEN